jgi:hypothetical protein
VVKIMQKLWMRVGVGAAVVGLAACAGQSGGGMRGATAESATTNHASLRGEPRWAVLFGGQDLSSFDRLGHAQWNIRDGYAEADNQLESWLVTRGQYRDFELHVEFWPSSDANSGIFLRCQDPGAVAATSCYEINVFDQNENPNNRTGAIINHAAPLTAIQAGGQWNTFDIRAQGTHIVVHLNGQLVADLEDDSYAQGPIGFQSNGGVIRFRNVSIRPL